MKVLFTRENFENSGLIVAADFSDTDDKDAIAIVKRGTSSTEIRVKIRRWADGEHGEEEALRQACRTVIDYAKQNGYTNIAFDTQSFADISVNNSYVANILTEELSDIAQNDIATDITVTVLFPADERNEEYIDELEEELAKPIIQTVNHAYGDYGDPLKGEFEKYHKELNKEKTFRQHLLDIMNQRGIRKNSEVYIPSSVSKYTFSKIINFSINPPYKPSKDTVAALAIGLKLNIKEAEEFYGYAGFHLGKTEFVDKVIRFFIKKGIYRIYDINYCLMEHGYPILGEKPRGDKFEI